MTVSARSARGLAETAKIGRVELRRGGRALAGSYLYEGHRLVTGFHSHDLHQIQYAMALLAAPGQSVQETATAVGFERLSSFTRAFTQFCGETPSSYRRRVNAATV